MESHKATHNKTQEEAAEKTAFEKFEDEVKEVIFGVLSVLLKDDETAFWGFVVGAIIDSFQMYQFIFDNRFPWELTAVSKYVNVVANAFELGTWVAYTKSWIAYLVIFYVCILLVVLMILDVIYVAYSFTKKKFSFIWPVHALRSVCGLVVTVLFQPFMEYFTTIFVCNVNDQGVRVHNLFSTQKCWVGLHILHVSFGAIIGIMFVAICMIVVYTFFETKSKTNDPSARSDSKCEIFIIVYKLLITLMYSLFAHAKYRWMLIILLCSGSTFMFYTMSHERPYYNETVAKFLNCVHGGYMYSTYVVLIIMALEGVKFTAGIQLFVIGYPIFIIIIVVFSDGRNKTLLKPLEEFDSGKEWQIKTRYFLTLLNHKDTNKYFNNVLKGYIYDHEDTCLVADCPLKAYKTSMIGMLNDKKKKQSKGSTIENPLLLLNYANRLFTAGLAKFPECTSLRISYAFFLIELMGNKNRAVIELGIAEKCHPPFDEEFIIYRYRRIIEDEMQEAHSDGSGNLDIVNGIAYDNHVRQCKSYIEKAALYHHEFWTLLIEDKPDFIKLDKSGSKINSAVASVEDHWARLQKISPNEPKSLRMYAEFLIEIMNDKEGGSELLSRAKDTALSKNNFIEANVEQSLLQSDGAACIVASGESNKLGEIIKFNQSTCRIFGFNNIDLQGRKISMIIPEMLVKFHDQIMVNTVNNNDDLKDNPEKIVLGKHKCGYIIPLHKMVRTAPSFTQGLQFFATFKAEKKSVANSNVTYIMIDVNKEIKHVSSSAMAIIGINNRILQKAKCNMTTFAPTMFEQTYYEQYIGKNGGELEYFFPEILKEDESMQSAIGQSGIAGDKKSQFAPHKSAEEFKPRMSASKTKKTKFKCNIGIITFNDIGQAGHFIRLETLPAENVGKLKKYEKISEFQFLYNVDQKKYYRVMQRQNEPEAEPEKKNNEEESSFEESKVSFSSDDEAKKSAAAKEKDKTGLMKRSNKSLTKGDKANNEENKDGSQEDDDSEYEYEDDDDGEEEEFEESGVDDSENNEEKKEETKKPTNKDDSRLDAMLKDIDISEINLEDNEKGLTELHKIRQDLGLGIQSKRLGLDGLLIDVAENQNEEEAKKMEEEKKEEDKKDDESEDKNLELFRNNIKSKKALNAAIKEKVEPPAISKLKKTAYILLVVLLALISSEYGVILSQFNDISENLDLVKFGYERQALQMRIVYDIGKLVYYSKYENFSETNATVNISRQRMESELNQYYDVQNSISLSKIALSNEHKKLYDDKVVTLYFNEKSLGTEITKKKMYFTLTEAILQMTSSIFTILNLKLTKANFDVKSQDDVEFVLYNSFSDINDAIAKSSNLYVVELLDRSGNKNKLIMIFFILSISVMMISIAICFPVITSVGKTRMGVLQLFLSIPMPTIKSLIQKCEKYTNKTPDEANEDADSLNNESFNNADNQSNTNQGTTNSIKNVKKRDFSNNNTSNIPFFLKYIFGCVFLEAYFAVNYGLAIDFLGKIKSYGTELNATALIEAYDTYSLSLLEYIIY